MDSVIPIHVIHYRSHYYMICPTVIMLEYKLTSDFTKAFDTVPHKCLLYKLEWYGIRGNIKNWICSFLNNCTQCVVLDGVSFPECSVLSGAP